MSEVKVTEETVEVESTPPFQLYHQDGRPTGIWACGGCRRVFEHEIAADGCCGPRVCECGAKYSKKEYAYTCCRDCLARKTAEREQAQWDKAEKITVEESVGSVYDDDHDEFHDSIECFLDWLEDAEDVTTLPRVYACRRENFEISADSIVENALDEHHEGAYDSISAQSMAQLQSMLDVWCGAQRIHSWYPDYSRAIVYEPREREPEVERPWRPGPVPTFSDLIRMSERFAWWVCPQCNTTEIAHATRCSACGFEGVPPPGASTEALAEPATPAEADAP